MTPMDALQTNSRRQGYSFPPAGEGRVGLGKDSTFRRFRFRAGSTSIDGAVAGGWGSCASARPRFLEGSRRDLARGLRARGERRDTFVFLARKQKR
jgi:hypothetical protein